MKRKEELIFFFFKIVLFVFFLPFFLTLLLRSWSSSADRSSSKFKVLKLSQLFSFFLLSFSPIFPLPPAWLALSFSRIRWFCSHAVCRQISQPNVMCSFRCYRIGTTGQIGRTALRAELRPRKVLMQFRIIFPLVIFWPHFLILLIAVFVCSFRVNDISLDKDLFFGQRLMSR